MSWSFTWAAESRILIWTGSLKVIPLVKDKVPKVQHAKLWLLKGDPLIYL